jgi:hypothetical protein
MKTYCGRRGMAPLTLNLGAYVQVRSQPYAVVSLPRGNILQTPTFFLYLFVFCTLLFWYCSGIGRRTACCGFFQQEKSDGFGRERTRDLGYVPEASMQTPRPPKPLLNIRLGGPQDVFVKRKISCLCQESNPISSINYRSRLFRRNVPILCTAFLKFTNCLTVRYGSFCWAVDLHTMQIVS